jgi:hypothetical protein
MPHADSASSQAGGRGFESLCPTLASTAPALVGSQAQGRAGPYLTLMCTWSLWLAESPPRLAMGRQPSRLRATLQMRWFQIT